MAIKVAEIFIETLVNAGVKRVYGVVGDSLNGLTVKYPRIVYAVGVVLNTTLNLSALGSSQAAEAGRTACLHNDGLTASMELARELISPTSKGKADGPDVRSAVILALMQLISVSHNGVRPPVSFWRLSEF